MREVIGELMDAAYIQTGIPIRFSPYIGCHMGACCLVTWRGSSQSHDFTDGILGRACGSKIQTINMDYSTIPRQVGTMLCSGLPLAASTHNTDAMGMTCGPG
jgi:hypothetical protein